MYDYAPSELATIDEMLEPKLAWAEKGTATAQQLALDATRMLSCTEDRLEDYKNKGFFKRCWGGLSGKTGEMNRANQHDLIEMQRISWRFLNQLQERDLMTAHAIITVKNNLLTLAIQEEETRAEIERMANRIYERFEQLEERMRHVEAASGIHGWLLTLDTRDYDEKFSPHFRLLRVLRDFYFLKSSDWNMQELRYLQQALKNVELPWKRRISLQSFICELVDEIEEKGFTTYDSLISIGSDNGKIAAAFVTENIAVPSYVSLFEVADKYSGSSTVIEVLAEQLSIPRKDAITKVLLKFVENQGINLEYELPLRDVAVELLHCLQLTVQLNSGISSTRPQEEIESESSRSGFSKVPLESQVGDKQKLETAAVGQDNSPLNSDAKGDEEATETTDTIRKLRDLAEQGNANAQYELAKYYEDKEMDKEEVVKWYRLAAEQGYTDAQCALALTYTMSDEEYVMWLSKAADKGHAHAQYTLSQDYHIGLFGLEEDERKAFNLAMKAAEQGHFEAQKFIADCYELGWGCSENESKAAKWREKAESNQPAIKKK